ncbi:MAG: Rid family hydrolase, partial [Planctomycetota bacterium]
MSDLRPRQCRSNAAGIAPGGHYSHAVAAGGFVFVSGQLPVPPGGAADAALPMREQSTIALRTLASALAAAGAQ